MENLTINQGIKFTAGDGTGVIGTTDPSGSQGIAKTAGHTGFYITSDVDYTLWFYDGSSWSAHQSIDVSDANYSEGFSFAWGSNTAAYIKTADSSHEVYVFGRDTDLKVDSTPNDGNQSFDQVVDGTGSLSITSIDAQNDYTSGISITDGTVSFNRTDQNAAYSLTFSGNGITVGNDGSNTITLTGADEFTTPLTTDGDMFVQAGGSDARLGIGSDGQYLSVSSGAPAWVDLATGISIGDSISSGTANRVLLEGSSNELKETDNFYYSETGTAGQETFKLSIESYGIKTDTLSVINGPFASTYYTKIGNSGKIEGSHNSQIWKIEGNGSNTVFRNTTAHPMILGTNNSTSLYLDGSSSKVMIGAFQSPNAMLEIKGEGSTSATSAFVVKNSSNSTLFEVKDDGSMTGVLALNGSGVLELAGNFTNTIGGSWQLPALVIGNSNTLSGGGRRSIVFGNSQNVGSNYIDSSLIGGSANYVTGALSFSLMVGQSQYAMGKSTIVLGYGNQVYGGNYGSVAIGSSNMVGTSSSDTMAYGFAFGANHKLRNNPTNRQAAIGFGIDTYYSDMTNAIYFGVSQSATRPTMGIFQDPDATNGAANFVLGGFQAMRTGSSAYPVQSGIGAGCIIFNDTSQDTKAPTTNVANTIHLYMADRPDPSNTANPATNGKGLIVKGESDARSYFGPRVGINVEHNTAKGSQLLSPVEAGLHIYGEGNSNATSAVKVENSDGNVAIEVLNDLVVVMPNLPTSSAGLPTGALYNDGGTVKVA